MRFFDFTRSPASARLMLAFAEERGAPVGALLSAAGLSRAQLDDPHTDITALQELRIAERLVQALGAAPGLGMEVGLRYSFSTYGIWGLGLVSSATAADAMSLALRSMPLAYAFSLIAVHEDGDTVVLSFGEPDVSAGLRRFLVARLLQLSERTLKRRLQDDGTSFRALLADARQQQARTLLADGALSLTDIAEQMGFSDLSSFSQAFKRWFGVAPSRMR